MIKIFRILLPVLAISTAAMAQPTVAPAGDLQPLGNYPLALDQFIKGGVKAVDDTSALNGVMLDTNTLVFQYQDSTFYRKTPSGWAPFQLKAPAVPTPTLQDVADESLSQDGSDVTMQLGATSSINDFNLNLIVEDQVFIQSSEFQVQDNQNSGLLIGMFDQSSSIEMAGNNIIAGYGLNNYFQLGDPAQSNSYRFKRTATDLELQHYSGGIWSTMFSFNDVGVPTLQAIIDNDPSPSFSTSKQVDFYSSDRLNLYSQNYQIEDDGGTTFFTPLGDDIKIGWRSLNQTEAISFPGPNRSNSPITIESDSGIGLVYAADYSVTFSNRSLVDKAYVDNAVAGVSGGGSTPSLQQIFDASGGFINGGGTGNIGFSNMSEIEFGAESRLFLYTQGVGNDNASMTIEESTDPSILFNVMKDGAGTNNFSLLHNRSTSDKRIEYLSDLSAGYTSRSLVDKAYVDNAVAGVSGGGGGSVDNLDSLLITQKVYQLSGNITLADSLAGYKIINTTDNDYTVTVPAGLSIPLHSQSFNLINQGLGNIFVDYSAVTANNFTTSVTTDTITTLTFIERAGLDLFFTYTGQELNGSGGNIEATNVGFTPSFGIAANNVQNAIVEAVQDAQAYADANDDGITSITTGANITGNGIGQPLDVDTFKIATQHDLNQLSKLDTAEITINRNVTTNDFSYQGAFRYITGNAVTLSFPAGLTQRKFEYLYLSDISPTGSIRCDFTAVTLIDADGNTIGSPSNVTISQASITVVDTDIYQITGKYIVN